ncbi:hypothetical protein CANARDRAFT_30056 [[Candida] arabinofermentans NRRL YB-2248]|uniref:Multiple RNA-binding domain-containing protein 1 n=1 Tax=[Candida] arabinofermentans NRRL YB-2248 TaxID=983967 RepID=A0A1E4SUW1_9ASCO|nr:hypothetical protein CANARDRAFT_30056 [[Candida] arabinofermentans NRRL YB-2248]
MSRIIVKGLPIYYNEEKLKAHFSKQGSVTDVKLMKKRNGESRKFAFIGYKSNKDAENAVSFFNSSFIDTSKIDVQLAKTFNDPNVPLPWKEKKRLAEIQLQQTEEKLKKLEDAGMNNKNNKGKNKKISLIDEKIENNSKLKEYLEAVKPKNQTKSWANDEIVNSEGAPSSKDLEIALLKKDAESITNIASIPDAASDDEYEDFNKQDEDEEEEMMIPLTSEPLQTEDAEDETPKDMDDLEWLRSKRIRIKEGEDEVSEKEPIVEEEDITIQPEETTNKSTKSIKPTKSSSSSSSPPPPPQLSEQDISIEKISKLGRLFIRNILYTATEEEFRELFSPFGELEEVHIAIDTRNGTSKGFAYIKFKDPKDAVQAYLSLDKEIFQGRLLHILPGDDKKDHKLDEYDLSNLPLKKQKELKRKYQASQEQFSWNSLYMNTDSIMESVASKLGISKSDLIDPQNSNSAVKQALAEANIIGDVRKYFENKGVDLTQFNKNERDDKVILIKNFQHGTTKEEIGEMFSEYGQLNRVLMPPAGTIAIVEFRDAPAARKAFNKLSYRRLGKSILYLEKGPKNLFNSDVVVEGEGDNDIPVKEQSEGKSAKISTSDVMDIDNEKEVETINPIGPTVSIFVKNLNFSTTTQDLTNLFKPLDGFVIATVKTKPNPKDKDSKLSMGFGFVEFKTKSQADAAIHNLDGYALDGHNLQLKISSRVSNTSSSSNTTSSIKRSRKSSKIIVKNLAFEATRKDIFELFNSFGNLKSVRVPKKFNKSARGFGFVEFSTMKEAENAMDQLQGVHLLGRKLILDFAELESDDAEVVIEKMTKKAKLQTNTRKMAAIRENNTAKRNLNLEDEEEGFNLNQL